METNVNNTFFTGKFLLHLPSVDSTNNYAKQHIAKSSPIDGTVILADEQLAGRGQSGTVWLADANKNLTFSIIYKTSFLRATEQFYLSMAISLGIKYAISSILNTHNNDCVMPTELFNTKIKWPNDIYIDDKKLAGILIENTISGMYLKYSVIGIGLNINQDIFPEGINATSLKLITENDVDKNVVLNKILASIEKYYFILKERKFEQLKSEYLENLLNYNTIASYKKEEHIFEGKIVDIDAVGNLVMEIQNGTDVLEEKFAFKEIAFLNKLEN